MKWAALIAVAAGLCVVAATAPVLAQPQRCGFCESAITLTAEQRSCVEAQLRGVHGGDGTEPLPFRIPVNGATCAVAMSVEVVTTTTVAPAAPTPSGQQSRPTRRGVYITRRDAQCLARVMQGTPAGQAVSVSFDQQCAAN